jgi:hypothetical protein
MVVESQPVPSFIVVRPHFAFHLFEFTLDSQPDRRQTDQVLQQDIGLVQFGVLEMNREDLGDSAQREGPLLLWTLDDL